MPPAATSLTTVRTVSYAFIGALFLLVVALRLTPLLLAVLFGYFILDKLHFNRSHGKWMAVTLFLALAAVIAQALVFFIRDTLEGLPEIVDKSVPSVIRFANEYGVELPFTDFDSLRCFIMESVTHQLQFLGHLARGATLEIVYLVVGGVAAISLFLHPQIELDRAGGDQPRNLYSFYGDEIAQRFASFYHSFSTVMGAQIAISAINTLLTAIFVLAMDMPHPVIIIGVTFSCGLVPVIGNLVSNTIITIIGFTVSPQMALIALLFLIVIHKLEYFLNSRIIGSRIRTPVWLMLLGLIVGERTMGLCGMILAPVLLYYLKVETAKLAVVEGAKDAPPS